jgi:hypothetical protein
MVNGRLPAGGDPRSFSGFRGCAGAGTSAVSGAVGTALSQILPQLRSFKFSENLRCIRVE